MSKSSTHPSFSKRIKAELCLNSYTEEEKHGILSSYARSVGSLSITPQFCLNLSSSSATVSRFVFNLFKELYGVEVKIDYTKQLRLDKNVIYHIHIEKSVEEILKDLELNPIDNIKPVRNLDSKHFRGYVIGAFLASGLVSDPNLPSYFCELSFDEESEAKAVLKGLLNFRSVDSMAFKLIKRRNKYVLYLKRSDQISMFLSYIGAQQMMFEFENSRLEKDYFNNENRLTICAQANYSRALKNGEENLEDIALLEKYCGASYFNQKMKEVAEARKKLKDASYQELANYLNEKGIYVSRSGVARIFKKFQEDAKRFKNSDD